MDAFENLDVWKRSSRLSVRIYKSLEICRDYSFRDHLFRSAVSIPSNISEGHERGSRKEYVRFLNIAKGSCAELRTQLYIAMETGHLDQLVAKSYVAETVEISKMLQGLINRLRTSSVRSATQSD